MCGRSAPLIAGGGDVGGVAVLVAVEDDVAHDDERLVDDGVHDLEEGGLLDGVALAEERELFEFEVEPLGGGSYSFRAGDLNGRQPDREMCRGIRASILLAGPLLGRRGDVDLPPPGGDVIGRRRIDTHVLALEALGARMSRVERHDLRFEAPSGLAGAEIFLDEASVTGTENAVMAAAPARGGRRRKYYRLTNAGELALAESYRRVERMADGLTDHLKALLEDAGR